MDRRDGVVSEAEKKELLSASLVNIGRLLARDMEVRFYRLPGDADARMELTWPDGSTTESMVIGCSPLYPVRMVEAVDAVFDKMEH